MAGLGSVPKGKPGSSRSAVTTNGESDLGRAAPATEPARQTRGLISPVFQNPGFRGHKPGRIQPGGAGKGWPTGAPPPEAPRGGFRLGPPPAVRPLVSAAPPANLRGGVTWAPSPAARVPRRLGFPGSYSSSSSGSAPGARPRPFDPRTRAPRDVTAALIQRALRPTRVSRQRARVGVGPPPSTGAEPRELQTRPATDAYPAGPRAPGKRQPRGLGSRGSGDRTWPGPAAQGPGKLTERGTSPQPGRRHPLRACLWVPAGVPVTCVPALGHGGEAAVPLLSSLPSPGPLPAPKCEGGQDWGGWPLPSSAQTVFKGYLVGREGDSFARESPLGIPRPGVPPPHLAHLQLGNGVALVPRPWAR